MGTLAHRVKRWYWHDETSYLYLLSPAVMLAAAPPPVSGLRVHVCDRERLARVKAAIPDFPTIIEPHIRRGDLGIFAATDAGWVFRSTAVLGPKTYPIAGYPLVLSASDAYLECAETIPTWRGRGVAPGMLGPTARELVSRGVIRIYMTINVTNTASCRAAEKGGAERIGIITSRRRIGRWHVIFTQLARASEHIVP
jgi:hypothetical protein